jgi:diguanylate cyclase (GGDEF)-like protein
MKMSAEDLILNRETPDPLVYDDTGIQISIENHRRFSARAIGISLICHSALTLLFLLLRIWLLVAACILSIGFYLWVRHEIERMNGWLLFRLSWVQTLTLSLFCVWMLGTAAGFQFYSLALIPVSFLSHFRFLKRKVAQVFILIVFFLVCDIWLASMEPVFPLPSHITTILRHLNIIGICILIAIVSYLHSLSIKEAVRKLHRLASTDTLTGLLNRRRFGEIVTVELARHHRTQMPLSVIMGDIDFFKTINDRYGHHAGDHVLLTAARLFRAQIREYDSLARWGGEEFLILLPDTNLETAVFIAERLRSMAAASAIPFEGRMVSVSITFGVAQLAQGEDWHSLVSRADAAMYRGKSAGRNRVEPDPAGDRPDRG